MPEKELILQGISYLRLVLGWGLKNNREAEVLEAADITAGGALRVPHIEIVLAEFVVGGVPGEHVIDANEQFVGDGQCRPSTAPAALQPVVFGFVETAAFARGGNGGVAQRRLQVGVALRAPLGLCLPALSLLPGQVPLQAAR